MALVTYFCQGLRDNGIVATFVQILHNVVTILFWMLTSVFGAIGMEREI